MITVQLMVAYFVAIPMVTMPMIGNSLVGNCSQPVLSYFTVLSHINPSSVKLADFVLPSDCLVMVTAFAYRCSG